MVGAKEITTHYLKGWFTIDVLGILPISYIGLFVNGIPDDLCPDCPGHKQAGSDIKALKVLRLFRLAKMLRLRKLKEVLKRFEDHGMLCSQPVPITVLHYGRYGL